MNMYFSRDILHMIIKYALSDKLIIIFEKIQNKQLPNQVQHIDWKKLYYELYREPFLKLKYHTRGWASVGLHKPVEHKNQYINGIINRINYKKNIKLYKKICNKYISYTYHRKDCCVYDTLDEYSEKEGMNSESDEGFKLNFLSEYLLTSWKWFPSYINSVKYNFSKDNNPYAEHPEGIKWEGNNSDCGHTYHDKDYLILRYSGLGQCKDLIHKIYVTKEDARKAKKIINTHIKKFVKFAKI